MPTGCPNVRMVLLKGFDERGFVFYTNMDSQKGRELDANPKAALLFHWKSLNRQVRLRGPVERVTEAEADAYFATPRAAVADRRLGEQAVGAAGKPARLREGDRALHRQVRDRHGAAAAALVGLPDRSDASSSSGRTGRSACTTASSSAASAERRAVEQDAALSVS